MARLAPMLATASLAASHMAAACGAPAAACHDTCSAGLQTGGLTATAAAEPPCAGSGSPNTPSAAQRTATITPTAGTADAPSACAAAATAVAAAAAPAGGAGLAPSATVLQQCDPATLERRVRSFLVCVSASPLVQSALLALEMEEDGHPPAPGAPDGSAAAAGCLEATLQMVLSLHLRAGYERASESGLLAALWTLESLHSAWRSSATAALASYVRLLAAFSPELVRRVTQDWPESFRRLRASMAATQLDLLKRLGWRALLRYDAEVAPCHAWICQLGDVCASIRAQAQALKAAAAEGDSAASTASHASPQPARDAEWTPSGPSAKKRLRTALP